MKINDSIVYNALKIFMSNESDLLVAVLAGVDVDSGTAWEMGVCLCAGAGCVRAAHGFSDAGVERVVNLMIGRSVVMWGGGGSWWSGWRGILVKKV